MPQGREAHIDVPLSNLAIAAFETNGDFVAQQLLPVVPVDKQSDKYYTLDKDSWLLMPNTYRAPKTKANRIEFKVSSDSYFADNYALGTDNALEDLDNADRAVQLRENGTNLVTVGLLRDYESRVASLCKSNVSSIQRLTGASAWDAVSSADIAEQVAEAHQVIFNGTGLRANTLVLDYQSYLYARRNKIAFEKFKYRADGSGILTNAQMLEIFEVDRILIARSQKNVAKEGATASVTSIWGPTALLARVEPAVGLKTATYGLSFRWTPEGLPAPFQVTRQVFAGAGTEKVEVLEAGYYQDEKVVASALGFYINTKSGNVW